MNTSNMNLSFFVRKANQIRNAIKDVQNYTSTTLEKFLQEMTLIDSTKYKLLVAIEGCIAICNHIASRIGKRVPESYSDCFQIISELGVISEALAENLMEMAKFRNLLTHIYWTVDDKKVYSYSKNNLGDLEKFLDEIGKYLKEKK